MKVAIVFNSIYPYRSAVFDLLGKDYVVIYSCKREPNRRWYVPELKHNHVFLKERFIRYGYENFYHINFDIFKVLKKIEPDVVILYGFGLTQQFAFLWSKFHKRQTIVWTDGWSWTERDKSRRQVAIARFIVNHSSAFIATGIKTRDYLVSLGAEPERVFISRIVR